MVAKERTPRGVAKLGLYTSARWTGAGNFRTGKIWRAIVISFNISLIESTGVKNAIKKFRKACTHALD